MRKMASTQMRIIQNAVESDLILWIIQNSIQVLGVILMCLLFPSMIDAHSVPLLKPLATLIIVVYILKKEYVVYIRLV